MKTQSETAKEIKKALKSAFPGVTFSVKSGKGSSSYIHINYQDGLEVGASRVAVQAEAIKYSDNWNLLVNHKMSIELCAEIESMVANFYGEEFDPYKENHRQKKYNIFELECKQTLPTPQPVETKEAVKEIEFSELTKGLTGVIEKPTDENTPVFCIEACEGKINTPYAQEGSVSPNNPIYFDNVESLELALNLHLQNMKKGRGYNKHTVIVTMPCKTSHKFRIDVGDFETVNVKEELLNTFKGNKAFLVSIQGGTMASKEHPEEIAGYDVKIQNCLDWMNKKTKPQPVHPDFNAMTDEQVRYYQSHYQTWLNRLIAESNLSCIRSFKDWYALVKDGMIELS